MPRIHAQLINNTLVPFSEEDSDILREYEPNKILTVDVKGAIEKPRSYQQLKAFWAGCKVVADNTSDPNWNNKDKVALQIKVALRFVDLNKSIVAPNGTVCVHYRSISYAELKHMEACDFFNQAFDVMARKLGIDTYDFLKQLGVNLD